MKRYILCILLTLSLFTGCVRNAEFLGIDENDPRLSFEQLELGVTYTDSKTYMGDLSGYNDECIIKSLEELKGIEADLGLTLSKAEATDFDKYMIFAVYNGSWGKDGWSSAQKVSEIAYNDKLLQIEYLKKGTVKGEADLSKGKYVVGYSMIRIPKDEFPYNKRDFQGLTVD